MRTYGLCLNGSLFYLQSNQTCSFGWAAWSCASLIHNEGIAVHMIHFQAEVVCLSRMRAVQELREVTKLADAKLVVLNRELAKGLTQSSLAEIEESRPKKRMQELLRELHCFSLGYARMMCYRMI